MGGGGDTTQKVKADPWKPTQPYLTDLLGDASGLYQSGQMTPQPFQGDRVAGFGQYSQMGMDQIAQQAGGPQAVDQGKSVLLDMMSSQNMGDRLDAVKQNALGSAIPAAMSQFAGSGMGNSTLAMDTVGRAATQAVAPYDYQAFQQGQDRMMQAAGMAPALDRAGYLPGQMLGQIGARQDALSQAQIDADMSRYYEQEGLPMQQLRDYYSLLGPIAGQGGTQSSSVPGASTGQQILGSAATGLGTYGALAGAGLGGPIGIAGGLAAGLAGLL